VEADHATLGPPRQEARLTELEIALTAQAVVGVQIANGELAERHPISATGSGSFDARDSWKIRRTYAKALSVVHH
jgi:hypothetical protein